MNIKSHFICSHGNCSNKLNLSLKCRFISINIFCCCWVSANWREEVIFNKLTTPVAFLVNFSWTTTFLLMFLLCTNQTKKAKKKKKKYNATKMICFPLFSDRKQHIFLLVCWYWNDVDRHHNHQQISTSEWIHTDLISSENRCFFFSYLNSSIHLNTKASLF